MRHKIHIGIDYLDREIPFSEIDGYPIFLEAIRSNSKFGTWRIIFKKTIIREIEFQSTENQLCNALELPDVELIAVDRIDRSILDLIAPVFKTAFGRSSKFSLRILKNLLKTNPQFILKILEDEHFKHLKALRFVDSDDVRLTILNKRFLEI